MPFYSRILVALLLVTAAYGFVSTVVCHEPGNCSGLGLGVHQNTLLHNCASYTVNDGEIDVCTGFANGQCTGCTDWAGPTPCYNKPLVCFRDRLQQQ